LRNTVGKGRSEFRSAKIESFANRELIQAPIADIRTPDDRYRFRWLAEFHHVGKASGDHLGDRGG